jgi:hypothetical protein
MASRSHRGHQGESSISCQFLRRKCSWPFQGLLPDGSRAAAVYPANRSSEDCAEIVRSARERRQAVSFPHVHLQLALGLRPARKRRDHS